MGWWHQLDQLDLEWPFLHDSKLFWVKQLCDKPETSEISHCALPCQVCSCGIALSAPVNLWRFMLSSLFKLSCCDGGPFETAGVLLVGVPSQWPSFSWSSLQYEIYRFVPKGLLLLNIYPESILQGRWHASENISLEGSQTMHRTFHIDLKGFDTLLRSGWFNSVRIRE